MDASYTIKRVTKLKTRCPHCEKAVRYLPDEAGMPALCSACGSRFSFPSELAVADTTDEPSSVAEVSEGRHLLPWVCVGVAAVTMAAIALVGAMSLRPKPAVYTPLVLSHPESKARIRDVPALSAIVPGVSVNVDGPRAMGAGPIAPVPPAPDNLYLALPPVRPLEIPGVLTDAQISASIHKAVDFLMDQMDQRTFELRDQMTDRSGYHAGADALCVYALIMAGQTINDPRLGEHSAFINGCLDRLKQLPIEGHAATYAHALRATALGVLNRPADHKTIEADAVWLIHAAHEGAYTYGDLPLPGRNMFFINEWDNSNSQYGLLGVWSAAEAGIPITPGYWEVVQKHWVGCQLDDGQFPYYGQDIRFSMTCAGLASLFVTQEHLRPSRNPTKADDAATKAIVRGLAWLEQGNRCVDIPQTGWPGYSYYGLERVGLASGYKYFGTHDWYRELAGQLIDQQANDGSWPNGDESVNSAFCLLFLARGSHPLIMSKLRFAGQWNAHPDDLIHLAHYAGEQLERPLNWQVVPADHNWQDWTDSPVLYLSGEIDPQLTDDQEQGLRSYVENGGLLFTCSVSDSHAFSDWASGLAKRLFPNYPLRPIDPNSDLLNVVLKLGKAPDVSTLRLRGVSNGSRLLMIQSDGDIAKVWQAGNQPNIAFDVGLNLSVYASGKAELRNRLSSLYVPPIHAAPLHTLNIARLRYGGNWNPEPAAWERFGRIFQVHTSWGIKITDVDLADLRPHSADVAVLTGTDEASFSSDDARTLAEFVNAGGVLFIDVCGGRGAFEQSVADDLFPKAFGSFLPHPLGGEHPLVRAGLPGMTDLSRPHVRQFAEQALGFDPTLPRILRVGYGHVIFSSIDMTSGLLGTGTWGITGYTADYATAFAQNTLLWTARGQADE